MSFTTREQVITEYRENHRLKSVSDVGFTWIFHKSRIGVFTCKEFIAQINLWWDNGMDIRCDPHNSKTFEVEGNKHHVLIAQIYKEGKFSEEDNYNCPMSLMLFGTMVSGMTYAFEDSRTRDTFVRIINDKNRDATNRATEKIVPICCLCRENCDCEYGHNPYPLFSVMGSDHLNPRCCSKCNREQVIPARMKGVFRCEDIDDEMRADILADCRKIVNKQYDEVEKSMWEEIGFEKTHPDPNCRAVFTEPAVQAVLVRFNRCMEESEELRKRALDETMVYCGQRLDRHIRCRSISSPEDICLTTRMVVFEVISVDLKEHIHKHLSLVNEFKDELELVRQRNEAELLAHKPKQQKKEKKEKSKEELKKEATRNANKAKAEEKRRREEFERQSAIAQAYKAEQQKKKQREIAKKKHQAFLAQAEKINK